MSVEAFNVAGEAAGKQAKKTTEQPGEVVYRNESQSVKDIAAIINNLIGSQDGRDFQLAAEQIRHICIPEASRTEDISASIREIFVADDLKNLISSPLNDQHIEEISKVLYRNFLSDLKEESINKALEDVDKLGEEEKLPTWFVLEEKLNEMLQRGGADKVLASPTDARDILGKIYIHIQPEKAGEPMPITLAKYADQLYVQLNNEIVPELQKAKEAAGLGGVIAKEEAVRDDLAQVLEKYRKIIGDFEKQVRSELGK